MNTITWVTLITKSPNLVQSLSSTVSWVSSLMGDLDLIPMSQEQILFNAEGWPWPTFNVTEANLSYFVGTITWVTFIPQSPNLVQILSSRMSQFTDGSTWPTFKVTGATHDFERAGQQWMLVQSKIGPFKNASPLKCSLHIQGTQSFSHRWLLFLGSDQGWSLICGLFCYIWPLFDLWPLTIGVIQRS